MIGVNKLSTVPCRAEGSDRSEMVTQLLYGESYDVLEEAEKWLKIKGHSDLYEGWIPREQFFEVHEVEARSVLRTMDCRLISPSESSITLLSPGSRLSDHELDQLDNPYGTKASACEVLDLEQTIALSKKFLNSPYLWGGRSRWGIDCSGFTQVIMLSMGVTVARDASQQALIGKEIPFENRQRGDLAYFKNKDGEITHVGILLDSGQIIHASGMVRIDEFDSKGIFKKEINRHSHVFSHLRRITI
jgi:hypothetical protein